jgi:hypothetical protein
MIGEATNVLSSRMWTARTSNLTVFPMRKNSRLIYSSVSIRPVTSNANSPSEDTA